MRKFILFLLFAIAVNANAGSRSVADNPYVGLRQQALSLKPTDIDLTREKFPHEVWGVVVEVGEGSQSYTLVVLADMTVSLYLSSGGGMMGAGDIEGVLQDSGALMIGANHLISQASITRDFSLPESQQVSFYFLTFDGIASYKADFITLQQSRNDWTTMYVISRKVVDRIMAAYSEAPNA